MKLLTAILLIFSLRAEAGKYGTGFTKQIYVVGVGQLKLQYVDVGEPVFRPERLKIWVKCEGKKSWKPVGEYHMCDLDDYQYDSVTKELRVLFQDGRVSQGVSYCDVKGDERLPLANLCTAPAKK